MSDIYQITLTTQTGETFTGKMSRRQPELVNGLCRWRRKRDSGCISLLPTLSACSSRLCPTLLLYKRMKIKRVGNIHHP